MKRIILMAIAIVLTMGAKAQSQFLSADRYEQGDRAAQLDGQRGAVVLSTYSDIVLTVTNTEATITPRGKGGSGYYEYEIVSSHNNLKIKFNRRGNIITGEKTIAPKKDFLVAYLLVEPKTPIEIIDQSSGSSTSLSREFAEVEINSNIPNLKVDYSPHLQAEVKVHQQEHDNSITTTTLRIPLKVFKDTKANAERLRKEFSDFDAKLTQLGDNMMSNASEGEWAKAEQMQKAAEDAEQIWDEINAISIYVPDQSNVEQINGLAELLGPEIKKIYGVRLLNTVEVVHKTQYSGFMEDGARLYEQRNYKEARQAYVNALEADDAPEDMKSATQTSINQCDTCMLYERYTLGAFGLINDIKKNGGTQAEVAEAAAAAIEYLTVLNRYNPDDFYGSRITKLEKMLENQPLEIQFTTVRWVHNDAGFYEAGKIPGVQIWTFRGDKAPSIADIRSEKKFRDLVNKSNAYEQVAVTNDDGVADVVLRRNDLPTGLILRPTGKGSEKIKPSYHSIKDLIGREVGTYKKITKHEKMAASY